jgi:small subunit ribosomal protein S9
MATKESTYIEAVGRRKTATARVRMVPSKQNSLTINDKSAADYFTIEDVQKTALEALKDMPDKFAVTAKVSGGGLKAQAEAIRHGVARALIKHNSEFRKGLKQAGFLKRDQRMKERKKFGLKGARRSPQWSKR